eukprot:scaffold3356_cov264-Pinguiococcus_pyrenoidosus.AAC.1
MLRGFCQERRYVSWLRALPMVQAALNASVAGHGYSPAFLHFFFGRELVLPGEEEIRERIRATTSEYGRHVLEDASHALGKVRRRVAMLVDVHVP